MIFQKAKVAFLSAAIAAGGATIVASPSVFAAERDREEWVKYEDTPREVKRALDRERGNHEIKRIDHVFRNGREFYRAIIDTKGEDVVVRVDPDGKVVSRDAVADVPTGNERRDLGGRDLRDEERQVKFASLPERVKDTLDRERGNRELKSIYEVNRNGRIFYRAIIDERNGDRVVRVGENGKLLSEEDVREVRTAGAGVRRGVEDDGERIAFDRLPGEVKTVIGREAGPDRVGDVFRYDRRGRSTYEAEINSSNGTTRVVRVDENGRVLSDTDATPEGRRSVRFSDLPGPVKDAIGRQARADEIDRVVEVTQGGRTYYRALVNNGRDRSGTWITVDENGRTVRDFDVRR
jgi:hypothetical protein